MVKNKEKTKHTKRDKIFYLCVLSIPLVVFFFFDKRSIYEEKPGVEVTAIIIDKSEDKRRVIFKYMYRVDGKKYKSIFTASSTSWDDYEIYDEITVYYSKTHPFYSTRDKWW